MPRSPRNYAAEYAARKARGVAAGKTAAQAAGHARREAATVARRVAAGLPARLARPAALRGPGGRFLPKAKDLTVGGRSVGRTRSTSSTKAIRDELNAAVRQGQLIGLRVIIDKGDGKGPKTRLIDGRGAQADVIAGGAGGGSGGGGGGGHLIGDVQITRFDPAAIGGRGIDPQSLIDYLDDYDWDWEDAFYDIADADYFTPA